MKKTDLDNIDWIKIQKIHDDGVKWIHLPKLIGKSRTVLDKAVKLGYLKKIMHKKIMSNDEKKRISVGRIKYLKENPDKHPWKRNSKFKSVPCELFKTKLIENNIRFIEEFQPSNERFYSIDIAFPNKKIGIEINGNQHYENDGRLKEYYIKRNDFLNSIGWKLYDIHYSIIYNDELLKSIISEIKNFSLNQDDLNLYSIEHQNNKKFNSEKKCLDCGIKIRNKSTRCRKCAAKLRKSVICPSKEVLSELIKTHTLVSLGKKYNVSDNAVRKWAKSYGII
jgi:very-short-patch-repair endonuclease